MTIDQLRSAVETAVAKVKRNLVVVLPLVYAVVAAVPGDTQVTDYKVWGPVLVSVVVRQFFTLPKQETEHNGLLALDQVADQQFQAGVVLGKVIGIHPDEVDAVLPPELEHPLDVEPPQGD